jgi:hypothetical protein
LKAIPWLLLMGVLAIPGCSGCEDEQVIGASRNRERCESCWRSRRDNPVLQGIVRLDQTAIPDDRLREVATRKVEGFAYDYFRLDASVQGDVSRGATPLDLIPAPRILGVWEGSNERAVVLPWELRGVELGYASTRVTVFHRNRTGVNTSAPKSPIDVDLDPTVMLVPIQVVRVLPATSDAPFASFLGKYTTAVQKKFWDGRWDLDTFRVSEPGMPNVLSQHYVNNVSLPFDPVDDIWDQCGIQFRMITCAGSIEGCPDLRVTDPAQIDDSSMGCVTAGPFTPIPPTATAIWDAAKMLPGMRSDLPLVAFTWKVCAQDAGFVVGNKALIGIGSGLGLGGASPLTVAHELGHVLGLKDFHDCSERHLMCNDGRDDRRIRPDDCKIARTHAAEIVKRFYGVDVPP